MKETDKGIFAELEALIASRRFASVDSSYTAALLRGEPARVAQKVGEEGVELALASVMGDRERIVSEAADLLYHILVLLQRHDLCLADVGAVLSRRRR